MRSGTALLYFERVGVERDPTPQLRVAFAGIVLVDSHIEHTDLTHQDDLCFGTGNCRINKASCQHAGMTSQQRKDHHIKFASLCFVYCDCITMLNLF